ncbi:MAG TPA: MFS transporter [Thermomicrobiales bacterium]|jgi:MFS family permease|nr:MFS transporter [Thermomicrobiales bacterium]
MSALSTIRSRLRRGLWQDPDFLRLWSAQTISTFGSLTAGLVLSFLAINTLDASPFQLSLLGMCGLVPAFVAGPFVGVLVDRTRRRPVMILTDISRAIVVGAVPVAALTDTLGMNLLYVLAALMSVLSLSFDVANRAHLPWLVSRTQLTEANSRLTGAGSVVEAAAFASAGGLVRLLTAPFVFVITSLTFLWSAWIVSRIRKPEPRPHDHDARLPVTTEIASGFRYVATTGLLRAVLASAFVFNLFTSMLGTLYVLYILREIGFSEAISGVSFALGGAAALGGAVFAGRITRRLGVGYAMVAALVVIAVANLLVPLSTEASLLAFALILTQQFFGDSAWTVYEIAETSLVQAGAPDQWQGRVQSILRMTQFGGQLLGTLGAGLLPFVLSVRETMIVASVGIALATVPILVSSVRRLRDIPVIDDEAEMEEIAHAAAEYELPVR